MFMWAMVKKVVVIVMLWLVVCGKGTLMDVKRDELKKGMCHGLDFQRCVVKCKGMKLYKECYYVNKEPKCECVG